MSDALAVLRQLVDAWDARPMNITKIGLLLEKARQVLVDQPKYWTHEQLFRAQGTDAYARASRKAMRAYANMIEQENAQLATELREWVDREQLAEFEDSDDRQAR